MALVSLPLPLLDVSRRAARIRSAGPDPHLGARGRDGGRLRAAAAALVAFQDGAGGRCVAGGDPS